MQIRDGFVSNSSSSSFICEVTGEIIEGYDVSFEELNLCECEYGHVFLDNYTVGGVEQIDNSDDEDINRYNVPASACPICTLTRIRDRDIAKFIFSKYDTSRESICAEMRLAQYDVNA